jgi:GNAT superfamily N-acetyltransferase
VYHPAVRLRVASDEDRALVWRWANESREWSKSPEPIEWAVHLSWWRENAARIKIAEVSGEPVGYWRVDDEGRVSVAIASSHRGQGLGPRLIRLGSDGEPRALVAEILEGNGASEAAFRRAGYAEDNPRRRLAIIGRATADATGANTTGRFAQQSLDRGFVLRLASDHTEVSDATEAVVQRIWVDEFTRLPGTKLFDGTIYSVARHSPAELVIRAVPYRYFVAQARRPELFEELQIQPLAVAGVLRCADGVVLGRRSADVRQDPGMWEPVPSGGLDRPDAAHQVLIELQEELGLARSDVASCDVVALLIDIDTRVHVVVFALETPLGSADVRSAHSVAATDEYAELAVVPPADVGRFLADHQPDVQPAAGAVLAMVLGGPF